MKYFKQYKGKDEVMEITKEQARNTLDGYWKDEFLDEIFAKEKKFRLSTNMSYVWTDGVVVDGWYVEEMNEGA